MYPKEVLESIIDIARQHELIVFSDEIYDKILYDDAKHIAAASLADDVLFITYNGLSKAYRVAGFRAGWMIVSGNKFHASDYIEGIELLASMRLCSNVPGQHAIQTALGGYQSINELIIPGGRLCVQRNVAYDLLTCISLRKLTRRSTESRMMKKWYWICYYRKRYSSYMVQHSTGRRWIISGSCFYRMLMS